MSQDVPQEPAASEIRFDRAEFGASGSGSSCAVCNEPLAGSYFEINGAMACPACRDKVDVARGQGSATVRARAAVVRTLRSLAAGLGAAAVGAGIYYAVWAITGYQLGLIAIVVGFLVGRAVRWGSGARGGWFYQTMALALTYVAIVSTYVPVILKGMHKNATPTLLDIVVTAVVALVVPFLVGIENFMGWIIIGFALYQAWKMNRRRPLVVTGPFRLTPAVAGTPIMPAGDGDTPPPAPPALEPA